MLAWDEASGTTGYYTITAVWAHEDPVTHINNPLRPLWETCMFSAVVNGLGDLATDAFGYHNDAPTNAGLAATLHTYSYERATTKPIPPTYQRGDVILVLFPNSDLRTAKRRPALIVQADP
ncbi:MAG: hypothetical protein R3E79_31455 [Caldilineaceae bacterium]